MTTTADGAGVPVAHPPMGGFGGIDGGGEEAGVGAESGTGIAGGIGGGGGGTSALGALVAGVPDVSLEFRLCFA